MSSPALTLAAALSLGGLDPLDPEILPLLGVVSGPTPGWEAATADLSDGLAAVGIRSIRNNDYYDDRLDIEGIWNCPGGSTYPSWDCDPGTTPGALHWAASDAQVDAIQAGGFQLLLRLGGGWHNGPRPHQFKGPRSRLMEDRWIDAATLVARRYLDRHPGLITHLNLWTEFPGRQFWDRSPAAFLDFYARALGRLDAAFPQVPIGGPGLSAQVSAQVRQGKGGLAMALLTRLWQAELTPDWLGWHVFSNDPAQVWETAEAYQALLSGTGPYAQAPWAGSGFFDQTALMVDAWGLGDRGPDPAEGGAGPMLPPDQRWALRQGAAGAATMSAAWIALQHSQVQGAWFYRAGDPPERPGAGASGKGLFRGDAAGTPKAHAHAVRLWSRLVNGFPEKQRTPMRAGTGEGVWVLAGRAADGRTGLLLANPSDQGVALPGLPSAGRAWVVDRSQDGRNGQPISAGTVRMGAHSVWLIALNG